MKKNGFKIRLFDPADYGLFEGIRGWNNGTDGVPLIAASHTTDDDGDRYVITIAVGMNGITVEVSDQHTCITNLHFLACYFPNQAIGRCALESLVQRFEKPLPSAVLELLGFEKFMTIKG